MQIHKCTSAIPMNTQMLAPGTHLCDRQDDTFDAASQYAVVRILMMAQTVAGPMQLCTAGQQARLEPLRDDDARSGQHGPPRMQQLVGPVLLHLRWLLPQPQWVVAVAARTAACSAGLPGVRQVAINQGGKSARAHAVLIRYKREQAETGGRQRSCRKLVSACAGAEGSCMAATWQPLHNGAS